MRNPLDNQLRAKNAIICFYILMACYSILLVSDFMEYQLLTSGSISFEDADSNDKRQKAIALISVLSQLALIIIFIQWFRRAYHNLHKAGEKNLITSEGWAAGSWFIPILSLFRPYQIMVEIWDRTKNYAARYSSSDLYYDSHSSESNKSDNKQLIGWWWAFWLISSIVGNISNRIVEDGSDMDTFLISNILSIISEITGILSMIFAIKMIQASQQQQNKFLLAWKNKESGDNNGTFNLSDSDDLLI